MPTPTTVRFRIQSSIKYSLLPLIERFKFTLFPKGHPIKLEFEA